MMCAVAALAGCEQKPSVIATETLREACIAWAESLFLPSRGDTHETAVALTQQQVDFKSVCARAGVRLAL